MTNLTEPTPEPVDAGALRDEAARVHAWRFAVLLDCGYDVEDAEALAGRTDVDLHYAVELITRRGASAALAAKILL